MASEIYPRDWNHWLDMGDCVRARAFHALVARKQSWSAPYLLDNPSSSSSGEAIVDGLCIPVWDQCGPALDGAFITPERPDVGPKPLFSACGFESSEVL